MPERPVIDAAPLIFLTEVGQLSFLKLISEEVIVPTAVVEEIQRYGETDVTVRALAETDWLVVVDNPSIPEIIQVRSLDAGEEAALSWAYFNPGTLVITDDLAARRLAIALGMPLLGTVGLVILAKQQGEIAAVRPVLEQLRSVGLYLSDRFFQQALAIAGE